MNPPAWRRTCQLLASMALVSAPGAAFAQSPAQTQEAAPPPTAIAPQPVTLAQVLRLARVQSPQVRLQRARVEVARAEEVAAGAYPNPTLSYSALVGLHDVGYINGTQHLVTLDQPVLIAGQRGARQSAASLGVRAARARARADGEGLAREARGLFVTLQAAQERVTVLRAAAADLQRARQIVEGRAQSGMMSRYDVLRIDVEAQGLQVRLEGAIADADAASGRLAALLGLPGFHPQATGALDVSTPALTTRDSPEVAAARQEEAAAVARIDVAKRERWPTPVFGVGAQFTTEGYTLAGSLGLALDLPLFDRGQGAVARAAADAEEKASTRAAVSAEVETELSRARRTLEQRQHALSKFQSDVIHLLPELRQMSEDAYKNGQGTSLDLLVTLRTLTEAQASEIDYRESAASARVELLAAAGLADSDEP